MAGNPRAPRVAENIRETVARTLDRRVKDPRLGFVTVTDVKVTGDLQHATVYYTVLGDQKAAADTAAALESAKGLIRSEVGKSVGLRLTPTLTFVADQVPETAASIEDALRAAKERDSQIAAAAADKTYAGADDPYKSDEDPADAEDDYLSAGEEALRTGYDPEADGSVRVCRADWLADCGQAGRPD